MDIVIVGIIVVLGLFLYYGWKDMKASEDKNNQASDTGVATSKEDIIAVASTKVDVVSVPVTPVVTEEVKQAVENVEKVKKTATRKAPAKAVSEDAPAKVAKVKRQYTKKSKE